jgi:polyisoprenoid-binding protein YceI
MTTTRPTATRVDVPALGRYRIDPERSTIAVRAKHLFGLGTVHAAFTLRSGAIVVTDPVTTSTAHAVLDAASFTSGNAARDKKVRSKALLHVDQHPDIRFSADSASLTSDGTWTVHGAVTARGGSAPVELTVTEATAHGETLTVVATATVDRYAHGITAVKGLAGRYLEVNLTATAHRTG